MTDTIFEDLERLLDRVATEGTDPNPAAAWEGEEVPISDLEWQLIILDGCRSLSTDALVLVSELVEFLRPDKDQRHVLAAHVGEWLGDLGELLDPPGASGEERFPGLGGLTRFLHGLLVQPVEVRRAAIRMLSALVCPEEATGTEEATPSDGERRVLEVLRHLEPAVRHEIVFGLGAVADGDMAPASRALALALEKELERRRRERQDVRPAEAGWERRRRTR